MIEVLDFEAASKREIVARLARAKNIELAECAVERASELAKELVGIGFPIADAYEASLRQKFFTEPSQ